MRNKNSYRRGYFKWLGAGAPIDQFSYSKYKKQKIDFYSWIKSVCQSNDYYHRMGILSKDEWQIVFSFLNDYILVSKQWIHLYFLHKFELMVPITITKRSFVHDLLVIHIRESNDDFLNESMSLHFKIDYLWNSSFGPSNWKSMARSLMKCIYAIPSIPHPLVYQDAKNMHQNMTHDIHHFIIHVSCPDISNVNVFDICNMTSISIVGSIRKLKLPFDYFTKIGFSQGCLKYNHLKILKIKTENIKTALELDKGENYEENKIDLAKLLKSCFPSLTTIIFYFKSIDAKLDKNTFCKESEFKNHPFIQDIQSVLNIVMECKTNWNKFI